MKRLNRSNMDLRILTRENGRVLPVLLAVLVLVAAAGCYIYFFTDLVVRDENGNAAATNPTLVKKPMPQRPEQSAVAIQNKPVPTKVEPAINAGAEKSAPAGNSGHSEIHQSKISKKHLLNEKSVEKKLEKLTTAREKVNSAPKKKHAEAETKVSKHAPAAVKREMAEVVKQSGKSSAGTEKEKYRLLIGVYVMKKSMAPEERKLKSAGLTPVIGKGPRKLEPMNRILIASFDSYAEAALELKKISKISKDAFVLPEKGKYSVYAGSYFEKNRAAGIHERLAKAGFKSEIVRSKAPVTTYILSAGSFTSRESAEREVQRLKKLGLDASVIGSGT